MIHRTKPFFPGKKEFPTYSAEVRHALKALGLTAFALEYRLKRVVNVLRARQLASSFGPRSRQRYDDFEAMELNQPSLGKLLDQFWDVAGLYRQYHGSNHCCLPSAAKIKWGSYKRVFNELKPIRNGIAHGDHRKLLDQIDLSSKATRLGLPNRAKDAYNALIDVMALVNYGTRYAKRWRTYNDALREYAHLKYP